MTDDVYARLAEATRTRRGRSRSQGVMPRARRMHRRLNARVSLCAALGATVTAVAAGCGSPGLSTYAAPADSGTSSTPAVAAPADSGTSAVAAVTFDGHDWMPVKSAAKLPNLGAGRRSAEFYSVACPAVGACFAAGSVNRRSDGHLVTALVARLRQGRWSAAKGLPGDAVQPGTLSCASVSLCVAAGSTAAYVLDRGVWKRGPGLGTAACAVPDFCIGIQPTAYRYQTFHRGVWTAPRLIASLPGTNILPNLLACASPTFCLGMAYGYAYWIFDGTKWAPGRRINFPLGGPHSLDPTALSCASPSLCVTVGSNGRGDAMASVYNGNVWSTPVPVVERRGYSRLTSVSCPTSRFCAAVGTWSWPPGEFAVTFEADRWSSPALLASAQGDPSVACAAATYCLALTGEVRS